MKNENTHKTSSTLVGLALALVLALSSCSHLHTARQPLANATVRLNSDILIGPGECVLKKFQGTSVNNKFYLYWVFQSNTNRFLFEIESSVNGKNFKPCCYKQGALSPGSTALMLCMVDSVSKSDVVFYRIKAIAENYPIKKKNEQEYKAMFEASTIMIAKNKKTAGYMQDDFYVGNHLEAMSKK